MEDRNRMTSTMCTTDRRLTPRVRLRAFGRDDRGATILEFALVAAPFFALLLAILVTTLVFFAQQALETAGEAASRLIMTGQAQQGAWTAAQYKTQVCKRLPPILGCNNLMIDVETATSFSTASTGTPTITYTNGVPSNAWQYQVGGAGSIVIVRLMYLWPIATGPLGFNLGNQSGNKRLLIATSVAQTEPYTS
jgi:Flp pilus assembly protein TadG